MELTDLTRIVSTGESTEIEFKRSTAQLRSGMESICAMLNAVGRARILLGVSDSGELIGQQVSDKTLREIAQASRSIEPLVTIQTVTVPVGRDRHVLVLDTTASGTGPFLYEGRGYVRIGTTTQRMAHSELRSAFSQSIQSDLPWDRWTASTWEPRHLDQDEISSTVRDAIAANRLAGILGERPEVILRRLELLTDAGVTRAAAILFGSEGGPGFPMGEIRLARLRGVTKDEFLDNRQYKGHAFALLRHAERFLEEHVPIAGHFLESSMRRVDVPRYPRLALREAMVNALAHRDYSIDGGAVSVSMYDDRLEIWSTGLLPPALTPLQLRGVHESIPRNRLIAEVFYRRGLIERWGRGTNKIIDEAGRLSCPEPEFEEIAGSFVVRFRPARITERPSSGIDGGSRTERVVALLETSGPLLASEILKGLGDAITLRALQTDLRVLRESGRIVAEGKARATRYRMARAPE